MGRRILLYGYDNTIVWVGQRFYMGRTTILHG